MYIDVIFLVINLKLNDYEKILFLLPGKYGTTFNFNTNRFVCKYLVDTANKKIVNKN